MNVLAINGSPHGKSGNTAVMIESMLEGFREGGAKTESVELADMDIAQCQACHSCWFKHPGRCVLDDDMAPIIEKMRGADILLFGSHVHFCNISGLLKTFFDRMTSAGGNPHEAQSKKENRSAPGYIMVANCGFPIRNQFDVISLWIRNVAQMSGANLLGEFYAAGGKVLSAPSPEQIPARDRYQDYLKECATSMAGNGILDANLTASIDKDILEF